MPLAEITRDTIPLFEFAIRTSRIFDKSEKISSIVKQRGLAVRKTPGAPSSIKFETPLPTGQNMLIQREIHVPRTEGATAYCVLRIVVDNQNPGELGYASTFNLPLDEFSPQTIGLTFLRTSEMVNTERVHQTAKPSIGNYSLGDNTYLKDLYSLRFYEDVVLAVALQALEHSTE